MNKINFLLPFVFFYGMVHSKSLQSQSHQSQFKSDSSILQGKYPQVTVIDWDERGLFQSHSFWEENRDEVIKQIGIEEYKDMLYGCMMGSWPIEFISILSKDSARKKISNTEIEAHKRLLYEKLNLLKVYKIASFINYQEGQAFESLVILKVPYAQNINWDPKVKWNKDAYYFLINEKSIKNISPGLKTAGTKGYGMRSNLKDDYCAFQ